MTSGQYRDLVVADFNNDTHADIAACSSSPGNVTVWYGDGSGNLSLPSVLPLKADVRSVDAGDFNSDGRMDLVFSVQRESSGIMVWFNEPGRNWEQGEKPIEINNYEGVRTADINRDGHLDIIAANSTTDTQGGIQVWLGDGNGNWTIETGPTVTGIYMDVAVGDLNNDSYMDIVGSGWGTYGGLRLWLGDGSGNWSPAKTLSIGNYYGLSLGDVNGDMNLDILAGTYRRGIQVLLGNAGGTFTELPPPVEQGSYWRARVMEIDETAPADIVATSLDGRGIRAWVNRKEGKWRAVEWKLPVLGTYYDIQAKDLDHDDNPEILAANYGEGVKIFSGKERTYGTVARDDVLQGVEDKTSDARPTVEENEAFVMVNGNPEYKVGPGDVLGITLWEAEQINREEVEILPDGRISFGFIQNLDVSGLTVTQVDTLITDYLGEYIREPRIDVKVIHYRSKAVSVLGPGRVVDPDTSGKIYLKGKLTILELLAQSSIVGNDANLREVQVTRKSGRTLKLNLFKAMTQGDKTQDIVLDAGDVIYLPVISKEGSRVYVFGEVEKPGMYPFTGSDMDLLDAMSEAGGPTVFSVPQSTKILRGDVTNPEVISVNLKALMTQGDRSQNIALLDGDLVYVPRSAIGDVNVFVKRMEPFLRLISTPVRAIDEIDDLQD